MKTKKLMSIMAAVVLATAVLPVSNTTIAAAENVVPTAVQNTINRNYYGAQLNSEEQIFYNALGLMNTKGLFLSGKGELNLLQNGIRADQVTAALNGDKGLEKAFHNARDAYMFDHPEIFYMDFAKVTLRMGVQKGVTAAVLSNGSNANYYSAGFTSASQVGTVKKTFDQKVTTMKNNANTKTTELEKVRSIHTQIINTANYATTGNFITSAHGIVNKQANCQGYAKMFKVSLDQLGYENVIVRGAAVNSVGKTEDHMWNYVKLEGAWYGVDATWDDPIGGKLRETYFMVGSAAMNKDHFVSKVFSPNGGEFMIPELNATSYGESTGLEINKEGFTILTEKGVDSDNLDYTSFKVSFDATGATALQKTGKNIAMRYASDGVNYTKWQPLVLFSRDSKDGTYSTFSISKKGKLQFAVTTQAFPRTPQYEMDLSEAKYNVGLSEAVDILYIDNFVPGPMLRQSSPSVSTRIRPEKQKINVEFNEQVEVIDPSKPVTIEVVTTQSRVTYNVSDITWSNGKATLFNGAEIGVSNVEFTFDPDKTYQGSDNTYTFYVKNLRGVTSQKEIGEFGYCTSIDEIIPCSYSSSIALFSVANVKKIADQAVDVNNFKGTGSLYSTNIVLVAEKAGATASFDLTFNCLASLNFLKAGVNLKIGVPYPAGYDVRDQETKYTAYWFTKDANGVATVKKLQTQITERGLEVVASPL